LDYQLPLGLKIVIMTFPKFEIHPVYFYVKID